MSDKIRSTSFSVLEVKTHIKKIWYLERLRAVKSKFTPIES